MISPELKSAYRFHRSRDPAYGALIQARQDAAQGVKRYPPAPLDPARLTRPRDAWRASNYAFAESSDMARGLFRFVAWQDEIGSPSRDRNHRGWFIDEFQQETMRGAVLQVAGKGRRARYVAAYGDPWNDNCFVVDLSAPAIHLGDIGADGFGNDDGATECARAADGFAEGEAEEARDYSAAWQAGQQWSELAQEIRDARRDALAILAERRRVKGVDSPNLCNVIRGKVESLISNIEEARAKRRELAESVWREYHAAFNDGAGAQVLPV